MREPIFIIKDDGSFLKLTNERYDSEELLQALLASYPELLSMGSESETPTKLLLVKREMAIQDDQGASRWSLDHLFLDNFGVPTLVEVKRSTDTRLRREVVAQMLDYAANAVVHWPLESIQAELQATSLKQEADMAEILQVFLGQETFLDEFWTKVKTNLLAGKIRMIFVADSIPKELRRIIEFLNEQMDPAEVLGIEISQYVGGGVTSLVPKLVGQTMESEIRKSGSLQKGKWDEVRFFSVFNNRKNIEEEEIARKLYTWAKNQGLRIWWGSGGQNGSFYPMLDWDDKAINTFGVWTGWKNGHIEIPFAKYSGSFSSLEKKQDLVARITKATGEVISKEKLNAYPSIKLAKLSDEKLKGFLDVFEWYVRNIKQE